MATDELLYEVRDGIGRAVLNRPQARNAMTMAMYEGFGEICAAAPADGSLKAIVVEGAGGKAFAAGTDLAEFEDLRTNEDAWAYERRIEKVLTAIETCPVPTIAAIDGACTGGGVVIAVVCDLRVATRSLKFGFPIARTLGNCLSAANLARLVTLGGAGLVREMLFTARLLNAEETKAAGFVHELVDDRPALEARVTALAELLATHAPLTLRGTKEALRRLRIEGPDADTRDLVARGYTSRDFREGMAAFLEKRPPVWRGE
ncbi:MAG: enoyl-CoA hydratase/isomerase family protein [Pseudomonadota bacterium]